MAILHHFGGPGHPIGFSESGLCLDSRPRQLLSRLIAGGQACSFGEVPSEGFLPAEPQQGVRDRQG